MEIQSKKKFNNVDCDSRDDKDIPIMEEVISLPGTPDLSSPASSEIDIEFKQNSNSSLSLLINSTSNFCSLSPTQNVKKTDRRRHNFVLRKGNKIIYTAGRPPWYDCHGAKGHMSSKDAFLIGLSGGSASGKTTVATNIINALDIPWVVLITMDSFYREYDESEKKLIKLGQFDFDHPSAMDFDLMVSTLTKLRSGKSVSIPIYNFSTHSREKNWRKMYGANVIIFEGIHAFFDKRLTQLMDIKIFVDIDSDIRLVRRLLRDIKERGRDLQSVLIQYEKFVKPSFQHYIAPTMAVADIIIPRGGENTIALGLITDHIKVQLLQRGFKHRSTIILNNSNASSNSMNEDRRNSESNLFDKNRTKIAHYKIPENVFITPKVPQIIGLHTFIRDKHVSRQNFIFFSRRLSRIALEYATSFLPYETVDIETPQNQPYVGTRMRKDVKICGVSVIRAGETSERSLFEIFPPSCIRLGQILIQTNSDSGEPELFYYRLPHSIKDCRVILMDPTAATGATATMAIRVLIDHEVPEANILFVALILSEIAAQTIAYAFPKVTIITTAIDPQVSPDFYIIPGIGNYGDRYYGTESQTTF